jgi:sugar phosphate isomerase/epimerase
LGLTASNWPITAALLQFPGTDARGRVAQHGGPEVWNGVFADVADAGFSAVDLTDSWVRPGDLSATDLTEFAAAIREAGLTSPVISVTRKSVISPARGSDNLAYAHRTIDAAAALGVSVVCLGFHEPLSEAQRARLWFWTAEGHRDSDDQETRSLAVDRMRDLGRHAAEVGVLLSLELYEDTLLGTGPSSVRLIDEIGMRNVGLNPDIGNLIRLHRPVEDWRELASLTLPYANYWQVKNYARDEDPATSLYTAVPSPLQFGLINYREAFAIAIAVGFQGIICTEHYGGDGLSASAANQEYLRRYVLPKHDHYELGESRVDQPVFPTTAISPIASDENHEGN